MYRGKKFNSRKEDVPEEAYLVRWTIHTTVHSGLDSFLAFIS